MSFGYPDTNPSHWDYCDLCSKRKYRGRPRDGAFYCTDCAKLPAIGADDVLDAYITLKVLDHVSVLLRMLGVRETYFRDP